MPANAVFRHFKGKYYQLTGLARDAQTREEYVLYRQMYAPFGYWIRPKEMFFGDTMTENGPVPRFARVGESHEDVLEELDIMTADICHSETLAIYRVAGVHAGAQGIVYEVKKVG